MAVRAQRAHDLVVAMFQCRATRGMGKESGNFCSHACEVACCLATNCQKLDPGNSILRLLEGPSRNCCGARWRQEERKGQRTPEVVPEFVCLANAKGPAYVGRLRKSKGKAPLLSFAGKWAPRERKQFDKKFQVVDDIASYMFPQNIGENASKYTRRKMYRAAVARLCKSLRVPEIYMSSKTWGEIDFKGVPSVCLNKWSKAFLNEKTNAKNDDMDNGNRFPDDEDRVACRKHMIDNLLKGKINGKQLFPHEVVRKCMWSRSQQSSIDTHCAKLNGIKFAKVSHRPLVERSKARKLKILKAWKLKILRASLI